MKKALRDNKVIFYTDCINEAIDFLQGLTAKIRFFEYGGQIYEIKRISDIVITIQLEGEFYEFLGKNNRSGGGASARSNS